MRTTINLSDRNIMPSGLFDDAATFIFSSKVDYSVFYHDRIPDCSLYFGLNGNLVLALTEINTNLLPH